MSKRKNTRPYLLSALWEYHPDVRQDHLVSLVEDDGTEVNVLIEDAGDMRRHGLGEIAAWLDAQGCVRTFDAKLPAHVASQSTAKIRDINMALAFIKRFG